MTVPRLTLLVLSATLALGCAGPSGPRTKEVPADSGNQQAAAIAAAQAAAQQGVVDDLYEQWRYDYVMYRKAVDDALARSQAPEEEGDPVRSLDEILRLSEPEQHDPEVKRLFEQWLTRSQSYDTRLRQLANDPDADPRSPLKPEVREALVPAPKE